MEYGDKVKEGVTVNYHSFLFLMATHLLCIGQSSFPFLSQFFQLLMIKAIASNSTIPVRVFNAGFNPL